MSENRSNAIRIAGAVSTALIVPAVLAYIGNQYTTALKEREIQAQYVKLAVEILQAQPTEVNRSVRTWATKVIDKYSGVPLGADAEKALVEQVPISIRPEFQFWAAPTADEIRKVQSMLKKLGFYKGEINGSGDQATVRGVIDFQKDEGITADGILGNETLSHLRKRAGEPQ